MNTKLLRHWISTQNPKGREKMAAYAEISVALVDKILRTGRGPKIDTAKKMAKVIGCSLDELCKENAKNKESA